MDRASYNMARDLHDKSSQREVECHFCMDISRCQREGGGLTGQAT